LNRLVYPRKGKAFNPKNTNEDPKAIPKRIDNSLFLDNSMPVNNAEITTHTSATGNDMNQFIYPGTISTIGIIPVKTKSQVAMTPIAVAKEKKGIPLEQFLNQSLISPATCCLVNQNKERTVEKAFQLTKRIYSKLREHHKLI